MLRQKSTFGNLSEFLRYLATHDETESNRLPPLAELSEILGVSIASLREQLEVARSLGIVEVRPRTGIRRLAYTFRPAVSQSLSYAIALDENYFYQYSDFRKNVEAAYWRQAVSLLQNQDIEKLREIIRRAEEKLHGKPRQIPQSEHREFHLMIYRRLDNPFVNGVLETFWEMYENVGLNLFTDLAYHEQVWRYHRKMVDAISAGNIEAGYQAFIEHVDLIAMRSKPAPSLNFE